MELPMLKMLNKGNNALNACHVSKILIYIEHDTALLPQVSVLFPNINHVFAQCVTDVVSIFSEL